MTTESHELRRWLAAGAQAVKRARERLDAINVFPVPDADTGTNMYLTLQEGNRAVAKLPVSATHREVVAAFARGALLGARGNSGVIVSQYLSAFLRDIDAAGGLGKASGKAVAGALRAASDAAYGAVGAPVEGTILTVAQAAADGAAAAATARASRDATLVAAVASAREALVATQTQLPAARAAHVVDAGAAGLLLQLEMLAETVAGPEALAALAGTSWELAPAKSGIVAVAQGAARHQGGAYEVMFVAGVVDLPDATDKARRALTAALTAIGDSVAVTATHGLVQAHVHTDHPDAAVDVGIARRARQILVSSLAMGNGEHGAASGGGTGMVALTSCPGLAAPLADAGAVVLVVPDPARLKRRELRRAVRDASGRGVVIVAGNPELRLAARGLADRSARATMTVLDADHEAQVIAAVAAGATVTPGEPLVDVMRAAIAQCRVAASSPDAIDEDTDRLLGPGAEVVTVILGRGVPDAVADAVRLSAAAVSPTADVNVYQGGQVEPAVLLGVEGP